MKETGRLEDLIKKKHAQIARLNEKQFKASIKTTILGQDALRTEYWHFKDDPTRIYMRKEEQVPIISEEKKVSPVQNQEMKQIDEEPNSQVE